MEIIWRLVIVILITYLFTDRLFNLLLLLTGVVIEFSVLIEVSALLAPIFFFFPDFSRSS